MAKLWGKKIILGEKTYAETPVKLREAVAEWLVENGHSEYVTE